MAISLDQILRTNTKAFEHMLDSVGFAYHEFVLASGNQMFRTLIQHFLSEKYEPQEVLDGIGRPYESWYARKVLIATALDIPMTSLEGIPDANHEDYFVKARNDLIRKYPSRDWYTSECFALRMRPMIEGSRKSLEGYWLYQTVRDSLERISKSSGFVVAAKDAKKHKDSTVITLTGNDRVVRVQVKGVNSARHHAERAKILAKFAGECEQTGAVPMPILVGMSTESYPDIPSLKYIRTYPMAVIESQNDNIDSQMRSMLCTLH